MRGPTSAEKLEAKRQFMRLSRLNENLAEAEIRYCCNRKYVVMGNASRKRTDVEVLLVRPYWRKRVKGLGLFQQSSSMRTRRPYRRREFIETSVALPGSRESLGGIRQRGGKRVMRSPSEGNLDVE